jgi:hypothetical protein
VAQYALPLTEVNEEEFEADPDGSWREHLELNVVERRQVCGAVDPLRGALSASRVEGPLTA